MSTSHSNPRRLEKTQARKLVAEIARRHPFQIRFSRHALNEIERDDLTVSDILNVIKSPDSRIIDDPEFENGSYRYRLGTSNIMVVIAFDTPGSFVVVTAWRRSS